MEWLKTLHVNVQWVSCSFGFNHTDVMHCMKTTTTTGCNSMTKATQTPQNHHTICQSDLFCLKHTNTDVCACQKLPNFDWTFWWFDKNVWKVSWEKWTCFHFPLTPSRNPWGKCLNLRKKNSYQERKVPPSVGSPVILSCLINKLQSQTKKAEQIDSHFLSDASPQTLNSKVTSLKENSPILKVKMNCADGKSEKRQQLVILNWLLKLLSPSLISFVLRAHPKRQQKQCWLWLDGRTLLWMWQGGPSHGCCLQEVLWMHLALKWFNLALFRWFEKMCGAAFEKMAEDELFPSPKLDWKVDRRSQLLMSTKAFPICRKLLDQKSVMPDWWWCLSHRVNLSWSQHSFDCT